MKALSRVLMIAAMAVMSGPDESLAVTITDDKGGSIFEYAQRSTHWKRTGTPVTIDGPCMSACTIYLQLPSEQLCITANASFHFHRSTGGTAVSRQYHTRWLMQKAWPSWVRDWILDQGGLRTWFLEMPYEFAAKHVRTC